MNTYKLIFDTTLCDKGLCRFMEAADLGINAVGKKMTATITTTTEPTDEYIEKVISIIEGTKDEETIKQFCVGTKLNRIEIEKGGAE